MPNTEMLGFPCYTKQMKAKLNGQDVFVDFSHDRWPGDERVIGQTTCKITEKGTRKVLYRGWAECSARDQFCKEIGRKRALSRAIKTLPRDARKLIWDAYFNRNALPENVNVDVMGICTSESFISAK